jgi:predicted nucleic acid-binding Zn ribbon protein
MPTYEFRCPDGTIVERMFKMSEVPQTIPSPNGDGVAVRIISGGADLIFKGSGFYITDYGKDGKRDQREKAEKKDSDKATESKKDSDKPAESKKEGDKATKTEAKADAKSDKPASPEKKSEPKAKSDSPAKGNTE